jgi:DNA-binding transcriptional MerR regulator
MKENITTSTAVTPGVMSEREAATYLRTKPRTLKLWRHTRGLPHSRISNKVVLYTQKDIDQWLARRRVAIAA